MTDLIADVAEFHAKFHPNLYTGKPRILPLELAEFRKKFLREEVQEYEDASDLAAISTSRETIAENLAHMLDALVDLVYVAIGTAEYHGFNFRAAWQRVHEANMQKVRAERASDSKRGTVYDVIKPPGWTPPDHSDLVIDHAHQEEP